MSRHSDRQKALEAINRLSGLAARSQMPGDMHRSFGLLRDLLKSDQFEDCIPIYQVLRSKGAVTSDDAFGAIHEIARLLAMTVASNGPEEASRHIRPGLFEKVHAQNANGEQADFGGLIESTIQTLTLEVLFRHGEADMANLYLNDPEEFERRLRHQGETL